MAKCSLILFVAWALIFCMCQAQRTNIGSLNIKVKRLVRKTDVLENEVDDIWGTILSSGIHDYGNKTRPDNVDMNDMDSVAKVDNAATTVKQLKSEVEHLVWTSRNGFKNEKKWQREAFRNLTGTYEDFRTGVTEEQGVINEHVSKILDDLRANQHKLETENQALKHTMIEIQTDNENMKAELNKLQAILTTTTLTTTTTTTPFPRSCDEGWKTFNGHCYLFVEKKKTWDDASVYCKNRDSYCIEITTDTELDFVGELTGYHGFWIGGTDRDKVGTFVYQHSKEQVPEKYWYEGQPDNFNGDERCAGMIWYNGDLKLFDVRCNIKGYFVCEKT